MSSPSWFCDANEIGLEIDNAILSNMVILGDLVQTNVIGLTKNDIEAIIRETFSDKVAQVNVEATTRGMEAVQAS